MIACEILGRVHLLRDRCLQLLLTDIAGPLEWLDKLHEKYDLCKTREAEDMGDYSEFLIEQGIEKGKLDVLEQLEVEHFSDE